MPSLLKPRDLKLQKPASTLKFLVAVFNKRLARASAVLLTRSTSAA